MALTEATEATTHRELRKMIRDGKHWVLIAADESAAGLYAALVAIAVRRGVTDRWRVVYLGHVVVLCVRKQDVPYDRMFRLLRRHGAAEMGQGRGDTLALFRVGDETSMRRCLGVMAWLKTPPIGGDGASVYG